MVNLSLRSSSLWVSSTDSSAGYPSRHNHFAEPYILMVKVERLPPREPPHQLGERTMLEHAAHLWYPLENAVPSLWRRRFRNLKFLAYVRKVRLEYVRLTCEVLHEFTSLLLLTKHPFLPSSWAIIQIENNAYCKSTLKWSPLHCFMASFKSFLGWLQKDSKTRFNQQPWALFGCSYATPCHVHIQGPASVKAVILVAHAEMQSVHHHIQRWQVHWTLVRDAHQLWYITQRHVSEDLPLQLLSFLVEYPVLSILKTLLSWFASGRTTSFSSTMNTSSGRPMQDKLWLKALIVENPSTL